MGSKAAAVAMSWQWLWLHSQLLRIRAAQAHHSERLVPRLYFATEIKVQGYSSTMSQTAGPCEELASVEGVFPTMKQENGLRSWE